MRNYGWPGERQNVKSKVHYDQEAHYIVVEGRVEDLIRHLQLQRSDKLHYCRTTVLQASSLEKENTQAIENHKISRKPQNVGFFFREKDSIKAVPIKVRSSISKEFLTLTLSGFTTQSRMVPKTTKEKWLTDTDR
ncbi:hypothetical protein J6590_007057 [Homalodisca vitripennis]|nr:hypothetical protein J6590_007057 [Homalodisca vitripennis]